MVVGGILRLLFQRRCGHIAVVGVMDIYGSLVSKHCTVNTCMVISMGILCINYLNYVQHSNSSVRRMDLHISHGQLKNTLHNIKYIETYVL